MIERSRPRVLLADDYAGLLTALQRLLAPSCDVVGHAANGGELLEEAVRLRPDVIVADLRMPDLNGLEACAALRQSVPHAKVIILTAADDQAIKKRALECGASAFVLKSRVADDLIPAVRDAWRDG
jgi:DNA-binding NarL/FixJ family response regulator